MKHSVKKCLALIMALAVIMSCALPALAERAAFPIGATNKVVKVTEGPMPGTYIANDGWSASIPYQVHGNLETSRITIPNYRYTDDWDEWVFNPDDYPGIEWHEDGFPMRAGWRTVVDYMGELKYLANTYPEITKLTLIGYSTGIKDDVIANNGGTDIHVDPNRAVPVYMLEISSAPGVMDGRPAALHQAGNHGGEIDSNELCMNLAWYLCTQYGKNDQVTNLVNDTRIYLLPYTNPDGNMINFRDRTNINPAARCLARGVDPNRNWAYRWGSNNGSLSYLGSTHRGRTPNSEVETQAVSSVYRQDNVITSISGHTSGEIIIFAWAFLRNTTDAHPLLTKLAKQLADLNGHTPQNGNVMYAQSGEINDYVWGSMRALGFTFEYSDSQRQSYLGLLEGDTWVSANYLDAAGNPKEMRVNYSTVAGSGKPAQDVTGTVAYLPDEYIAMGYQDLTPEDFSNGINNDPNNPNAVGPLLRRVTVEKIQAELDKNPDFVKGKIFLSHTTANATIGNEVAKLLKDNGAIGWILCGTSSNGGYSRPRVSFGAEGLPIAAFTKGYLADVFEHVKADPTITVTFHSENKDLHSAYYEWQRQKPAYMANMEIARDYANQLSGTITDELGNKLDATLNASLVIEGKVIDVDSNYGNSPEVVERDYDLQWKEIQRTRYDVEGGDYTWYMLPSKQSEYADKGWTITASVPGRYTDTKNVKFAVDADHAAMLGKDPAIFADPMFQQKMDGVNFELAKAFVVDQDLNTLLGNGGTVTFTTYNRAGAEADVVGAAVKVNGLSIDVTALGNGKYSATIPAGAEAISVNIAGAEAVAAEVASDEIVPLMDQATEFASLELTTDATSVAAGDTFGLNTAFVTEVDTNVVRLTYTYDPTLFTADMDASLANFAAAGYTVLNTVVDEVGGQVAITLMRADGEYGFQEFYPYTLKTVEHTVLGSNQEVYSDDPTSDQYTRYYVGERTPGDKVNFTYLDTVGQDMIFTAKDDVDFEAGFQTITVVADYVEDKTEKASYPAMVVLTQGEAAPEVTFDLIYLSNIVDAFGIDSTNADWATTYVWMDWVKNGVIDIADIAYAAQQIK